MPRDTLAGCRATARAAATSVVVGIACLSLGARQTSPAPQFHSATDLVQVDVSVLDKQRKPVLGLTAADFSIREDGKPQVVTAFSAIDVPPPIPPAAPWMRDVAQDVTTNQVEERRLVVLVLQGWAPPIATWEQKTELAVARDLIDRLSPLDATAVIVPGRSYSQDFTTEHSLLLEAVEQKKPFTPAHGEKVVAGVTIDILYDVATYLAEMPNKRKTIVYIGSSVTSSGRVTAVDLFRAALRGNTNIYCIDLNGLRAPEVSRSGTLAWDPGGPVRELMMTISNNTGGQAIVNTNAPMRDVPQILLENGSYDLRGFVSTNRNRDGRERRLEVKVNRPGVEVRARHSYYAPLTADATVGAPPEVRPAVESAIAEILPNREMPIEVTLASRCLFRAWS